MGTRLSDRSTRAVALTAVGAVKEQPGEVADKQGLALSGAGS